MMATKMSFGSIFSVKLTRKGRVGGRGSKQRAGKLFFVFVKRIIKNERCILRMVEHY
jgi:hypothetical protein